MASSRASSVGSADEPPVAAREAPAGHPGHTTRDRESGVTRSVCRPDAELDVQRAIRTINHCEFSPADAGAAWDDLVNRVENRVRPAGDKVLDVAVVAGPYYGCAFSDPAAYAAGTGSRRLFSACPAP